MRSYRLTILCSMFASMFASAIDLTEEVVIVGEAAGAQKHVVLIDDSGSMGLDPVSPSGGPSQILWNYFKRPVADIFEHVEEAGFAMTRIHNVWKNNGPQSEFIFNTISGRNPDGTRNATLETAIQQLFSSAPDGDTPLREPLANAAKFLLCKPGTQNLLGRGVFEDAQGLGLPGGVSKYDCWNDVDFTVDPDAGSCAKHSLWAFTDGGFYAPLHPHNIDPNGGVRQLLDSFSVHDENMLTESALAE